jgi:hypothetical protein
LRKRRYALRPNSGKSRSVGFTPFHTPGTGPKGQAKPTNHSVHAQVFERNGFCIKSWLARTIRLDFCRLTQNFKTKKFTTERSALGVESSKTRKRQTHCRGVIPGSSRPSPVELAAMDRPWG